jgi:hypothetical protein
MTATCPSRANRRNSVEFRTSSGTKRNKVAATTSSNAPAGRSTSSKETLRFVTCGKRATLAGHRSEVGSELDGGDVVPTLGERLRRLARSPTPERARSKAGQHVELANSAYG